MGLFKKCEDPLILEVRKTYNANPIRMPRSDIAPLCVGASNRTRSDFLGRLQPLIAGTDPLNLTPRRGPTGNALRQKSSSLGLDIGLNLLGGFLAAWGVPSADIGLKFQGARTVTFRFNEVARWFVDSTDLAAAVTGRMINVANPLVSNFIGANALGFYVIDATITSRDLTMRVEQADSESFSLAIPAIQAVVGKVQAGISVESKDSREVTFKGNVDMPFAFSCLQFVLDPQGNIQSIKPHEDIPSFGFDYGGAPSSSKRVLLSDEPGLLDFDSLLPA